MFKMFNLKDIKIKIIKIAYAEANADNGAWLVVNSVRSMIP